MRFLFSVVVMLFLGPCACVYAASECGDAPRIIGAFGAENSKPAAVELSKEIQSQLRGAALVRQVLNTHLSPTGEQIIAYDTDADDSDPKPALSFVVAGKVVQTLAMGDLADWGVGFERFQAACQFQLQPSQDAVALAFTSAFDGTGSIFSIVAWKDNKYALVFTTHGTQGRLQIGRGKLSMWTSTGGGECIWCDQHYAIKQFTWTKHTYKSVGTTKLKSSFDPSDISGHPLKISSD
jgi:hypothetical protein